MRASKVALQSRLELEVVAKVQLETKVDGVDAAMKTKDDTHKLVLDNMNKEHTEEMKTKDGMNQRMEVSGDLSECGCVLTLFPSQEHADREINRLRARLDEIHALTVSGFLILCEELVVMIFSYRKGNMNA